MPKKNKEILQAFKSRTSQVSGASGASGASNDSRKPKRAPRYSNTHKKWHKDFKRIADRGKRVAPPVAPPVQPFNQPTPPAEGAKSDTSHSFATAAMHVSTPSQLSVRNLAEYYHEQPVNEVFKIRGYKRLAKIDEGAFGVVSKAMRVSDRTIVAIKEVDLNRKRHKRIEEMKRELFVLQRVNHKNVVRLLDHFITGQYLVIIMEFCSGGNLTNYLKENAIGEDEAKSLFRQMAVAIKTLHRQGIAHRDVKLNNFLLNSNRTVIKIADFGLSIVPYRKTRGLIMAKTYCGTEPYMAPELLRRNSLGVRCYNPIYADIWSLGVCLFAMLTRTFPFKMNLSQRGLHRAQTARKWKFPRSMRDTASDSLRDLVCHMLDPEPERRITINGVMTHPWLNDNTVIILSGDET